MFCGMKQKALNRKSLFQNSKFRICFLLFLLISNIFAILGFLWSISPLEMQSTTIQLPDTYNLLAEQKSVQFPLKRRLTVSFPELIRYGDIQKINIQIDPLIDPSKCDDFCTEKHLTNENVWLDHKVKMLFSFDLNNIQMEPMGETIFSLAKTTPQTFEWKVMAADYNPAYIKSTIYLVFNSIEEDKDFKELVFARELTIPVKKAGPISFPIFRVICMVWCIASMLWLLLNKRIVLNYYSTKMM